jgi:hypothetical protein
MNEHEIKKLGEDFVKSLEWIEIPEVPATLFEDGHFLANGVAAVEKCQVTFFPSRPSYLDSPLLSSIILRFPPANIALQLKHSYDLHKMGNDKQWIFDIIGVEHSAFK